MSLYPHVDGSIWLRTCETEITDPIESQLTSGKIPRWLSGKLFRNGPGASKVGHLQFGHLFDNFGLIHCFTIDKGEATYQCRFVSSDYYKKIQRTRLLITDFGTKSTNDPCNTIFHRVQSIFNPGTQATSDNAMITIYPIADEMFAFGESPVIHRINKDSLKTEQRVNLFTNVGIVNHSAHPHIDHDGSMYNIGTSYTKFGKVVNTIVCFPQQDRADEMFDQAHIVATIPIRKFLNPSYMHSFGITENYFILIQQPLSVSLVSIMANKLLNEPLITALKWDKKRQTRLDVVSKKTGALIKSFYTESLFFLHVINQYELNNEIIIDICCYDDPSMIDCMYTEALKNMQSNPDYAKMFRGRPKRFVLDMKGANAVSGHTLCNVGCETPQINYAKCLGRLYRYFYAINSDVDCRYPGRIIKVDVVTGNTLTWCEDNCYPSEPIFVPKDHSIAEDDGIILASLVWGKDLTNRIGLLILDAKNFMEIFRCVFETPSAVPKCLHGWFSSSQSTKRKRENSN